ncbi:MAG: hypothetical protein IJ196_03890 [Prevotella sp.]|nr:hypothetical protein [Prevotella sp.]
MKKAALKYLGLPLVYAGVLVLTASYFSGFSRHNAVLAAGWLMVVAGCVCRIAYLKSRSLY